MENNDHNYQKIKLNRIKKSKCGSKNVEEPEMPEKTFGVRKMSLRITSICKVKSVKKKHTSTRKKHATTAYETWERHEPESELQLTMVMM